MKRLSQLKAGAALGVLTLASAAYAQAAPVTSDARVGADQAAPATSDARASADQGLQDIVVTAQRREENLQKAAIAVSAVAGDQLVKQSISASTELARLIPSVQIEPAGSYLQVYLRGVGTFSANIFAENSVSFNLDGVYLSQPSGPSGLFYDLDRIEVLKGPQGTLYGRNATGGAINVITKKPQLDSFGGYVNAEYGNYNTFKTTGAFNIPAGSDVAFRIAYQYARHDGYFSDGSDDERTGAIRGQVRMAPAGSRFDLTASVDYAHLGGIGAGGTILPLVEPHDRLGATDPRVIAAYLAVPPTAPFPQVIPTSPGSQNNRYLGAQATMNLDLGFAKLTFVPAYRRTHYDTFTASGGSFLLDINEVSRQTSLELRLASKSGPINWVVGGYYFRESDDAFQNIDNAADILTFKGPLRTRSAAAFGQLTYPVVDRFRLTGGIRYTSETKQQNIFADTRSFVGFAPGVLPLNPIFLDFPITAVTDRTTDKITWKAGAEFDAGPRSLIYVSASTGYKSGVLYPGLAPNNISRPEELTAYTLGSKNRFLDNRLQLNAEAFYWRYRDQQITHLCATPVGPGVSAPVFCTENAGKLNIYGLETEALFKFDRDDLVSINVQYLHTNYAALTYLAYAASGAPPAVGCPVASTAIAGTSPIARVYSVDCSGRPAVNAPKWTANFEYDRTFELRGNGRIVIGLDTRVQSSRYLTVDFLPNGSQRAFMKSNARVTYETRDERYSLTAFVNNIENRFTYSGTVQSPEKNGLFYNRVDPPRTFGVRAGVRF